MATSKDNAGAGMLLLLAKAIVLSALLSAALEAATVFGSFTMSVRDLSWWMPKRMIVFFAISLPFFIFILFSRSKRGGKRQQHRPHDARAFAKNALKAVGIPAAISLVVGWLVGSALAWGRGDAGDMRYPMVCVARLLCALLLYANKKLVSQSYEWGFLIIALCVGITCCALMPPAAEISWDGQIHFRKANALSYVFDPEYTGADQIMTRAGGGVGGIYLTQDDAGVEELDVELNSRRIPLPHASLEREAINTAIQTLEQAEASEPVARTTGTITFEGGSYLNANTIGLIPNALGLWVGRLFHVGCTLRYMLGRLFNTLVYVGIFFLAIRSVKNGKLILAAIGLCPTSLLMAANFSYDPWHVSWTTLSIALLVGALQRAEPLEWRDSVRMLVPFVLGAVVKAVIFPLALVFLIVPRRMFASKRDHATHVALVLASAFLLLASFAIPFLTSVENASAENQGDTRGGLNISRQGQVAYVLAHPIQTLCMGVVFTLRMLNPAIMGFGAIPADENLLYYSPYLIPTNAPLNEICAGLEYILLIVVALLDGGPDDKTFCGIRYKLCAAVSCLLSFALIAGALYVDFTEVGRNTISGVQYRYTLPLLAPILLFMLNTRLRRRNNPSWATAAFTAVQVILLCAVMWNSFVWQM